MLDVKVDTQAADGFSAAEKAELEAIEKEGSGSLIVPEGAPKEGGEEPKEPAEPPVTPPQVEPVKEVHKEEEPEKEDEEEEEDEDEEDEEEEKEKLKKMIPAWKLERIKERSQKQIADLQKQVADLQQASPTDQSKAIDDALKSYAAKYKVEYDSLAELRNILLPKELVEFYQTETKQRKDQERIEKENAKQVKAYNAEFDSEPIKRFFMDQGLKEDQIEALKPKLMKEAFKFPKDISLDRIYLASPELHVRKEKHTAETSRPTGPGTPPPTTLDEALQEKLDKFEELSDAEQAQLIRALPLDIFEKWDEAKVKKQGATLEWWDNGRRRTLNVKPF